MLADKPLPSTIPAVPPAEATTPKKRRKFKGGTLLSNDERQVRAEMILARRIQGRSMGEIQKEFGISDSTAYRGLAMAKKLDLYDACKDRIYGSLVPRAILVMEEALMQREDFPLAVDVALQVTSGVGLMGKHVTLEVQPAAAKGESFEEFRAQFTHRVVTPARQIHATAEPAGGGDTIDAVAVEAREAADGEGAGEGTLDQAAVSAGDDLARRGGSEGSD